MFDPDLDKGSPRQTQKPSQSPKDAEQDSQKQFAKRPKIAKEKRNDKGSR